MVSTGGRPWRGKWARLWWSWGRNRAKNLAPSAGGELPLWLQMCPLHAQLYLSVEMHKFCLTGRIHCHLQQPHGPHTAILMMSHTQQTHAHTHTHTHTHMYAHIQVHMHTSSSVSTLCLAMLMAMLGWTACLYGVCWFGSYEMMLSSVVVMVVGNCNWL